jgi:hypothetical protein
MISNLSTPTFTNNKVVIDIGEWQTLTVQIIGGTGTISLLGTNNPGDITGSTDGGPRDAANFNAVYATNLSTAGQTLATTIADTALYRIDPISFKYLQIGDGSTAAATKILVFKTKPY